MNEEKKSTDELWEELQETSSAIRRISEEIEADVSRMRRHMLMLMLLVTVLTFMLVYLLTSR